MTVAFIVGTAGVFLAFNWPPLLREIVLGYLMVAIVTWAAMIDDPRAAGAAEPRRSAGSARSASSR